MREVASPGPKLGGPFHYGLGQKFSLMLTGAIATSDGCPLQ